MHRSSDWCCEYLKKIWPVLKENARSRGKNISLIFADIDKFKQINDRYGHSYADKILREIVENIRFEFRVTK